MPRTVVHRRLAALVALAACPAVLAGSGLSSAQPQAARSAVPAAPDVLAAPVAEAFQAASQPQVRLITAVDGPTTTPYNTPFTLTLPATYSGRKFAVTSQQGTARAAAVRFETSAAPGKVVASATAGNATTISITPTVFQTGAFKYSINFAASRGVAATREEHTVTVSLPTETGVGVSAAPDNHYVSPNARFSIKGRITNDGLPFKGSAYAQLEQKFDNEWLPVGRATKAKADGSYVLTAVSEDLQAQTTYRVVVPDRHTNVATSTEFTIELAAGKHTAFKLLNARWQPCTGSSPREIKYGINVASIPPGYSGADDAAKRTAATADIVAAVEKVAAATGLNFVRVPDTQPVPQAPVRGALQAYAGGAELVIAFADNTSAKTTLLPGTRGTVLGRGGYSDNNGDGIIDQGYVALDARHELAGGLKPSRNGTWQQVIMHEVAHASGLTHPSDAKQIMNATNNTMLTEWGAGDLNGLRRIGVRLAADSPMRIADVRADTCG